MTLVASFAGIRLKNNIDYKKKVSRHQTVSKLFKQKAPESLKGYYLPNWDDDNNWTTHYENSIVRNASYKKEKEFKKKYPNMDAFRSYCYGHAEKLKSYDHCSDQDGWCEECVRPEKSD